MRRLFLPFLLAVVVFSQCPGAWAEPVFVNGLVFPGNTLDATRQPGANAGRLGFSSDIYYDPNRDEWWAVSDRGPGGGVLDYATRGQRFTLDVHPVTGRISNFRVKGKLLRVFQTPGNLIPKVNGTVNYVADRDGGANAGRQDNRGFEGLAITPDGSKLYAVLQDPLINEPTPNNGRNGRNLRIVVFDNDRHSPTYGTSIAQLADQLELQADIAARIVAAGGTATPTDPRQGRNIGLSAIVAINEHEFLVIERDNRGIGVDDPAGANVVGSKRVFKIDVRGATAITNTALPDNGDLAAAHITPVTKSPEVFIDLAANTLLPNGKLVEKWEGLTIGPRLKNGGHLILAGNDNDYSVTQEAGTNVQFDVYVDFNGGSVRRDLDQPTVLNGQVVGPVPAGFSLLPGVLHAYRASPEDLRGYVKPERRGQHHHDDDDDDDDHDHDHDRDHDRDDGRH
jgi:hypothetical protein